MNYPKNLITRLGVSVDVIMAASVTLGVGYADLPLHVYIYHLDKIDFKSGVELIINANQH